MNSDSEASGEWEEIQVGWRNKAFPIPSDSTGQFRYPWLCYIESVAHWVALVFLLLLFLSFFFSPSM